MTYIQIQRDAALLETSVLLGLQKKGKESNRDIEIFEKKKISKEVLKWPTQNNTNGYFSVEAAAVGQPTGVAQ